VARYDAAGLFVQRQMQAQDIRHGEEILSALGDFKAGGFGTAGRTFAPPANHSRAERFADSGDDTADFSISVNAKRFPVDSNPERRLPPAVFKPLHFIR